MSVLVADNTTTAGRGVIPAVRAMRATSIRALRRMYLPDEGMFVFCIRRGPNGDCPEGVSPRYTAIVLIGLATESDDVASQILHGRDARSACDVLLNDVTSVDNLGDVALTLWASTALGHPDAERALKRLRELDPERGSHPTVELAWVVSALSLHRDRSSDDGLAGRVAGRLKSCFDERSGAFAHWPVDAHQGRLRSHVSCFADFVYPVQALSAYHQATGDPSALELAKRCALLMCHRQGRDGQWWWHFDARTGRVVEGYPVYAVHQNSMAPMALFALADACGVDHSPSIARGVRWLESSRELGGGTLIDEQADLIWRKVARREPGKLSRGLQAMASRAHPVLRMPGLDMVFRPGRVDYECRPYHLGWILHAWPESRLTQWMASRQS